MWDKENGNNIYADCELAWTNLSIPVRKFNYKRCGFFPDPVYGREKTLHPTQKPLPLMHWCLGFTPDVKTVLDPFMGSGTTLLACKQKGIKCVGIEREKDYCDLAVERLSQTVLPLFTEAASQ